MVYRVRKSWDDAKSQIGAYKVLANAIRKCDQYENFCVFDESGTVVYPTHELYRVRKSWDDDKSQIGAYRVLQHAQDKADMTGLKVFNSSGQCVYTGDPSKVTITLSLTGGAGTTRVTGMKGETITLPAPTRAGYKFIGWCIDRSDRDYVCMAPYQLGKPKITGKYKLVKSLTLYACWYGAGAEAAADWAMKIAADNSFSYGKKPYASKCGCYYCGTNGKKRAHAKRAGYYSGARWDKTYVCCTFVSAAYSHGANNKKFLAPERRGSMYLSGCCSVAAERRKSELIYLGHLPMSKLRKGDILVKDMHHTAMYAGSGKIVEAAGGQRDPFGPSTILTSRLSDSRLKKFEVFRVKK